MNKKNQCPRCLNNFSTVQRLQSHLSRKTQCELIIDEIKNDHILIIDADCQSNKDDENEYKRFICEYCFTRFTRKDNMFAHQKKSCKALNIELPSSYNMDENQQVVKISENCEIDLVEKVTLLEKQVAELRQKPANVINNQNILQVVCIGNNDNYLDMLTEQWGFARALGFIKDCALSNLTGDCKLIEKIYLNEPNVHFAMRYIDKSRTKIEYFDENMERIVDKKGIQLGKKLANNLQNSYLKGVNYLINKNLDDHRCPNKFLEDYDLQTWNQHIYDLSDIRYQRKIVNQLNIPSI